MSDAFGVKEGQRRWYERPFGVEEGQSHLNGSVLNFKCFGMLVRITV